MGKFMLKAYFLSCNHMNQLPFQPDNLTIIAESEEEAMSIAEAEHGNGYEVLNSSDLSKGILDQY